jgi:hypothetical protein
MGTVRGNMGTVLEHAALVSAVQWAAKHAPGAKRSLRYIDTHAMAPLNEPHDRSFNWIGEFFEGKRSILRSNRQRLPEYHRTFHAARLRWLDGDRQAYPTHFIQAALAAQAVGCDLDAWLFENDSAEQGRRAEIEAFLSPESGPALQRKAGLFPGFFSGALAPAPGDLRVPEGPNLQRTKPGPLSSSVTPTSCAKTARASRCRWMRPIWLGSASNWQPAVPTVPASSST